MTADEQFVQRHKTIARWLTLWVKRVRKNSGAPIRYLLVCEAHKSGLPHYHMLLHERSPELQVRKRMLQAEWQAYGFTNCKLVEQDQHAARYVSKYLAKSALARVRASVRYGASLDHSEVLNVSPGARQRARAEGAPPSEARGSKTTQRARAEGGSESFLHSAEWLDVANRERQEV